MILVNKGFARGEISPYLYARPDLVDYAFGVRTLTNFTVTKEGVAQTRYGLSFVDECRSPSTEKRLIPFVFSTSSGDTYCLEFGDQYMEVVRAGGRVVESSVVITGITAANPPVVTTSGAHSYSSNDHVYLASISGMTQLNGRRFQITVTGASTFTLQNTTGTNIDASAYTAYSSGGTSSRVYKIATPYVEADLQGLKFAQSADVMVITHPDYYPRKLTRASHTSWALASVQLYPAIFPYLGTNGYVTRGGAGSIQHRYVITAIRASDGEESLTPFETVIDTVSTFDRTISAITNANPASVTTAGNHNYVTGDTVYFSVNGMTEINAAFFTITRTGATTFTLDNTNSTAFGVFTTGVVQRPYYATDGAAPTATAPNVVTVPVHGSANRYNIYKELNGLFGYIGSAELVQPISATYRPVTIPFKDVGVTPDTSDNPPMTPHSTNGTPLTIKFNSSGDYPSCVAFHQQRLAFGGSSNDPETVWLSLLGSYFDFTDRATVTDSSPITFTLNSQEVNPVRHIVPLRKAILLTGSQEWVADGNEAGTLTPSAVNARSYTNQGASDVRPAVVDADILYVQGRGNQVRSLFYDFGSDTYNGEDLTIKASHLFRGYSVRDMAYAKIPDSILWAVRNDGTLLSMTYSRREQIVAWGKHTTDGTFENVAVIPENDSADIGGEDAVYVLVKRTINGRVVRHIERMKERYVSADARDDYSHTAPHRQEELTFLDSFLTYDGRHTGAVTMTLSGSGWTSSDTLTLTASSGTFLSTDVGTDTTSRKFFIWNAAGDLVILRVTQYTSSTVVSVQPDRTVPATLQATARTTWAAAVRRVTGLWHIEGENVSALGDGFEIANALLDDTATTVASGAVTFDDFYAVIHVGLPIAADLEPLDVENPEGGSLYGKKKIVKNVGAYLKDTRSIFAGTYFPDSDEDSDEDYDAGLQEYGGVDENEENPDIPPEPTTGHVDIQISADNTDHGRCVVRILRPLPATILALSRSIEVKG